MVHRPSLPACGYLIVTLAAMLMLGGCAAPAETRPDVPATAVRMNEAEPSVIGAAETLIVHPTESQRRMARQPIGPLHIVTRQELERTGQTDLGEALRRSLTVLD